MSEEIYLKLCVRHSFDSYGGFYLWGLQAVPDACIEVVDSQVRIVNFFIKCAFLLRCEH